VIRRIRRMTREMRALIVWANGWQDYHELESER